MVEIERKFKVSDTSFKKVARSSAKMVQGFLNTDPERTVRVRLHNDKGLITIKGKTFAKGTSRREWEFQISADQAKELLQICEPGLIQKTRYQVPVGKHIFEVDEFEGDNLGLLIAEIELQEEQETFEVPSWLGEEVTGQKQYYNSQLSSNPYSRWKK